MTTSSDSVAENDLFEFLYCRQGYYLTYLIENGFGRFVDARYPVTGLSSRIA